MHLFLEKNLKKLYFIFFLSPTFIVCVYIWGAKSPDNRPNPKSWVTSWLSGPNTTNLEEVDVKVIGPSLYGGTSTMLKEGQWR